MARNPTSFRFPFQITGKVDPEVEQAIRYTFQSAKDLNDAIVELVPKVNDNTSSIQIIKATAVNAAAAPVPTTVTVNIGAVNNQSGNTAYTVQQSDYGAMVVVDTASPFALTLNGAVVTPYYFVVSNLGTSNITATPSGGATINGDASWTVRSNQAALIFYDGRNWWATPMPLFPQTIAGVLSKWLWSYDASTGIFVSTQPSVHNLSDSTTGGGKVVLDSAPTIISPIITGVMHIIPILTFPSNAAAISGGLVVGDVFKTGGDPDTLAIVH